MFTLVPSDFFDPATASKTLAEVAGGNGKAEALHIEIPQYNAVLIYEIDEDCVDSLPEIYHILCHLQDCPEYNKILCSWKGGNLYLAIAQGKTLLLCNWYPAKDFTTAEYFIFFAMKSLQLNPEVSTICWRSPIGPEEEMSLYRYFKAVDKI
ncbi:MAG: DUF3822 family protein [Bacteroidales bacterium]|nr:DUF3822 family protein [Bacteroidales bacterium]